jgi:CelD/BcsL family acetyltransferase involved in cellulose biosynthesis
VRFDVEPEWNLLASQAAPFLRPEFFAATARWLAPNGRLELVAARRDGLLVAMLPLVRRGGRLVALGSLHTPRFDVLGSASELWRVLRDDVAWHAIELGNVLADSPLATELVEHARADGFRVEIATRAKSPYFPLADFEAALAGDFRRKLMARRRKVPELAFERVTSDDEAALEDLFRLEAAAWKGSAGTAIASAPDTLGFYRDLARRFARAGQLSLTFLRSGGRRIAGHFALEDKRAYYLLKPGYDPEFAQFGPGHLLIYEAARDARERGLVELDFLGQDMDWKRSWTQASRQQIVLSLYRPNLRGIAAHLARYRVRPTIGSIKRAVLNRG